MAACPHCNYEKTQLLPDAFRSGGEQIFQKDDAGSSSVRGGLGNDLLEILGFERKGPKRLWELAAPPKKHSYFDILKVWFLATLVATFTHSVSGTIAGYAILFAAGLALLRAQRFNEKQWPLLYQRWQHSYICLQCGNVFELK